MPQSYKFAREIWAWIIPTLRWTRQQQVDTKAGAERAHARLRLCSNLGGSLLSQSGQQDPATGVMSTSGPPMLTLVRFYVTWRHANHRHGDCGCFAQSATELPPDTTQSSAAPTRLECAKRPRLPVSSSERVLVCLLEAVRRCSAVIVFARDWGSLARKVLL